MRNGPSLLLAGLALVALLAFGGYFALSAPPSDPTLVPDVVDAGPLHASDPAPSAPTAPTRRPNILLYTIDTLRADHLGSAGYPRDTSPTIDALAARGTRFTRAYSTSSWTLPAVASLLTGVLPSEHGAMHAVIQRGGTGAQDSLATNVPSLPAMLHDVGYRTVGVTTNPHLLGEAGFARGFDDYACTGFVDEDAARAAVWERLDALRDADAPYFLWVHRTDPHRPYQPREPQFSRWWQGERYPVLDRSLFLAGIDAVARRQGITSAEGLAYITAEYDSEIRATDDLLEDLLAEIDDGNLVVIITSDHGEELDDHHRIGHGGTLFEEVVHVPLLVVLPTQTPSVVTAPVSILDVLPTIAELTAAPLEGAAGLSLVSAMSGAALPQRDLVMESGRLVPIRGITDGHYKYAEQLGPHPLEALIDLDADPREQRSCLDEHPDVAAAMRDRLHATLEAARARHPASEMMTLEVPEEIRAHLRELGYEQPE